MRNGGNSQDRRRHRRAAERRLARSARTASTSLLDLDAVARYGFDDLVAEAGEPVSLTVEAPSEAADGEPEVSALELLMEFAPGDVLWGPEDGFVDLISQKNKLLRSGAGSMPDSDCCSYYCCVDVRIDLSAALIVDYDEECGYSAPITIGSDGEPILSDRAEWKPVDAGLIEVAEPDEEAGMSRGAGTFEASRIRFELRDIVLTADGALAPELPAEHQPGETMPRRRATPGAPKAPASQDEGMVAGNDVSWTAIFVPEASLTDDGRAFAPGSLAWRELPLSLMAMTETSAQGGHDGAVLAGRIDNIWREGNLIMASGVFDSGEFGVEIARMVGDKTLRGLSVDTAIHEYEIGPKSDYFDANGDWIADAPTRDEANDPDLAEMLFDGEDEDRIFVVTSAVIGMATVCPFPAFAGANISLVASGGGAIWRYNRQAQFEIIQHEAVEEAEAITAAASVNLVPKEVIVEVEGTGERMTISLENGWASVGEQVDLALTASAAGHAPTPPPAEWFEDPGLDELTPLTITDDGRIFGHAWPWETCHIAFPDECVPAPHSATENAYFHLGEIELDDGSRLSVGKITLDAPHAGARLSRVEATAHYDNTGTVVAHVVCGEDEFGGWVSGAIVPDLPEAKLRLLRGAALSGDWRSVDGNLELVALLAVNVPGFPVPRPRALVASGDGGEEVLSLTAAGVFTGKTPCDVAAEIAELAAEVDAIPVDVDADFAALVEQAEA